MPGYCQRDNIFYNIYRLGFRFVFFHKIIEEEAIPYKGHCAGRAAMGRCRYPAGGYNIFILRVCYYNLTGVFSKILSNPLQQ